MPTTAKMTGFVPERHGFKFVNSFQNDVIPEFDYRTGGLCGGMVYTALDYYFKRKPIPEQSYRPAVQTPLHDYIYDRQVDSIRDNLDKWAEVGFNPNGIRDSEFFNWGLQGFDGGRLEELREMIDSGKPVPLGLQEYDGDPGNHQVLAIGYDLGRYRGDLGRYKGDLKIFVYDPNHPRTTRTLVPNIDEEFYYYQEDENYQWRTYFVDMKYSIHNPPTIVSEEPAAAGLASSLLLFIKTGDDDLRGGNDNLNVTINVQGKPPQQVRNVNNGRRWISNYGQNVEIRLNEPVPPRDIRSIILTATLSGGTFGDIWDMSYLRVTARGNGVEDVLYNRCGHPMFRFTGEDNEFTANIDIFSPPVQMHCQDGIYGEYDLASPADRAFAFDFNSSGKQDTIALYRPGKGIMRILKRKEGRFKRVYETANGIGSYDLANEADRAFAFDYDSSGNLDHIALYRPGKGIMWILKRSGGGFERVFEDGRNGIGGFDLANEADRAFAYDYNSSGNLDHIVLYRPGKGIMWILKRSGGGFERVFENGRNGIGGFDLANDADRAFAFDYNSSGRLDHIALYRPGKGIMWILKRSGDSFERVFENGRNGIGGFDLASSADRAFAYDYDSSGHLDHIALYRPGKGIVWIVKRLGENNFEMVFESRNGIGGYDLASSADKAFAFDFNSSGHLDHITLYRPGSGLIWIVSRSH